MAETKKSASIESAQEAALIAVLDAVTEGIENIRADGTYNVAYQSGRVRDLALAYRLAWGGPQPGGVGISK